MMIPTLFGVTIITFVIMQLAPGDPMLSRLSAEGNASESGEHEAFLIQKRELKLDKPLLLNGRHFYDYEDDVRHAAWVRSLTEEQLVEELPHLAEAEDEKSVARADFLREIFHDLNATLPWESDKFTPRLMDPEKHERLAAAIRGNVQVWCENAGTYSVPAAMRLLENDDLSTKEKIGLIECINMMVVEPHKYTFSRDLDPAEEEPIVAVWRLWWERDPGWPPLTDERRAALTADMEKMLAADSRAKLFELMEEMRDYSWQPNDKRFFIDRLLTEDAPLEEKVICANILKLYVANPLQMTAAHDASDEQVERTIENWQLHYQLKEGEYNPGTGGRLWSIIGDTQYAHMVWRLVTFRFGRSALPTRDWVSEKIWERVQVSAPLMFMSSVLIYLIAIPLGIICSATHGRMTDKLIAIGLFFLYSIPAFVAGMLLLLYLAYGDYIKIFPMERLHGDGAEHMGFVQYSLDYLWHATLPVLCLSLFGLAPLAMYARTSMLEVLGQDYIRTARAKGLPGWKVLYKHGLRNALIPIITLFASFLPALLGGSVIIEVIFGIPGMGILSYDSILNLDIPTVMALAYINAILVMVSILLTDLLYVFVDPRITFDGASR